MYGKTDFFSIASVSLCCTGNADIWGKKSPMSHQVQVLVLELALVEPIIGFIITYEWKQIRGE